MADVRKIKIEFITSNEQGSNSGEGEKVGEEQKKPKKKPKTEAEKAAEKKKEFIDNSVKKAKELGWRALQQGLERYFSLTEDYISQTDMQIVSNVISETKSLVISTAAASAAAGPIGVGITLALWAGNKVLTTRSGYSEIRQGINQSNYNMNFQRIRMGLVDNSRGTEN